MDFERKMAPQGPPRGAKIHQKVRNLRQKIYICFERLLGIIFWWFLIKNESKNKQKSKKKLRTLIVNAGVVFGCFSISFLSEFSEFPKRANLENQAKTMECWSEMQFPMWRFGSNVNPENITFRDTFRKQKTWKIEENCQKINEKVGLKKKRLSSFIFHEFHKKPRGTDKKVAYLSNEIV